MKKNTKSLFSQLKRQAYLQTFVLLGMLFLFVFSYIPMVGLIIAFKDYVISDGLRGFFTSPWVGFKYFIEFLPKLKAK